MASVASVSIALRGGSSRYATMPICSILSGKGTPGICMRTASSIPRPQQFKRDQRSKPASDRRTFRSVVATRQHPDTVPKSFGVPSPVMKGPALREHSLYQTLIKRGAMFRPEVPDVDMQPMAYFDPHGEMPKWDPKQVNNHEWSDLVMREMKNTARNCGITHDVYSKFDISGPKAREFMERISTNVVAKAPGGCRLGFICDSEGQLKLEFTLATRGENDLYFVGAGGYGAYEESLLLPLRDRLGYTPQDVVIRNRSHHVECIHVAGPKAKEVLAEVLGREVVDVPFMQFRKLTIDGIPMEVFRMSFTGMPGWEFHVRAEHAATVYDKICEHPASVMAGLKPYGLFAILGLRIEKLFRIKPDIADLAHYSESGIDRFIAKKKRAGLGFHGFDPSFVPKKEFVFLDVDTHPGYEWTLTFSPKSPIFCDGEIVGHITSAALGGISGRTHACALLYSRNVAGELTVRAHGQEFGARVVKEQLVPFTGRD